MASFQIIENDAVLRQTQLPLEPGDYTALTTALGLDPARTEFPGDEMPRAIVAYRTIKGMGAEADGQDFVMANIAVLCGNDSLEGCSVRYIA